MKTSLVRPPVKPLGQRLQRYAIGVAVLALYSWAILGFEGVDAHRLRQGLDGLGRIIGFMLDPSWDYLYPSALRGLKESIEIALIGTTVAAVLAIPFGFLAASNVGRRLAVLGKMILNAIRTFPELLVAILFMKAVGPGAYAGVLAVGVHSIGMLGKLYSEVVEAIDKGPVEALTSTGANTVQSIWFAIVPQVLPEFASYAIYRFEINTRAATVLGLVGAGGIGTPLLFNLQQRNWDKVSIILLSVIVAVSIIDAISGRLRRRIIEG